MTYLRHDGPVAMAHRGFSTEGLENSMVAFAAAVDLGYSYVETDVHATADGVLLAFHDTTLDRVTDGTGEVGRLRWSQVRRARIRGREPIPTLDELLGTWPDLRVNIDVKSAAAVGPLAACLERHRAHDRVCIASFSDRRRREALRRVGRPVATSAGRAVTGGVVLAAAGRVPAAASAALAGVDCLQVPLRHGRVPVVTPRTLAAAHRAGVQVHVWTVDDPATMTRLLDLGVDGIITDRADLLREVLLARGQWGGPA